MVEMAAPAATNRDVLVDGVSEMQLGEGGGTGEDGRPSRGRQRQDLGCLSQAPAMAGLPFA